MATIESSEHGGHPETTKMLKLNNGASISVVGLGTLDLGMGQKTTEQVVGDMTAAIYAGHRFFDCAKIYGTEGHLSEAIQKSGIPRSEFTIMTKMANDEHDDPATALDEALERLKMDYVDIFVMHWPMAQLPDPTVFGSKNAPPPQPGQRPKFVSSDPDKFLRPNESPTFVETWKAMEKLVGPKCKAIGVSNFTQKTLDELLKQTTIKPVVNEIECHPWNPNLNLVPYCQDKGIQVVAWAPIAGGANSGYTDVKPLYTNSTLTKLADKYHVSVPTIMLAWHVARNVAIIPTSKNPKRMAENRHLPQLTAEEVNEVDNIHKEIGYKRLATEVPLFWIDKPGVGRGYFGWTLEEIGWQDAHGNELA